MLRFKSKSEASPMWQTPGCIHILLSLLPGRREVARQWHAVSYNERDGS
jgi:hypothetical protein